MRALNVRTLLFATAAGVFGVQMIGLRGEHQIDTWPESVPPQPETARPSQHAHVSIRYLIALHFR